MLGCLFTLHMDCIFELLFKPHKTPTLCAYPTVQPQMQQNALANYWNLNYVIW